MLRLYRVATHPKPSVRTVEHYCARHTANVVNCVAGSFASSACHSIRVNTRNQPSETSTQPRSEREPESSAQLVTLRASASAFFASRFEEAAVISIDGFGDFSSVTPDSVNHRHLRKGCPAMGTPTSQNYGNRRRKARCTMREQL